MKSDRGTKGKKIKGKPHLKNKSGQILKIFKRWMECEKKKGKMEKNRTLVENKLGQVLIGLAQ